MRTDTRIVTGWTAFDTKVYIDDMNMPAAEAATCAYLDSNYDWNLRIGNFIGCIDELRISNLVRY